MDILNFERSEMVLCSVNTIMNARIIYLKSELSQGDQKLLVVGMKVGGHSVCKTPLSQLRLQPIS